MRDAGSAVLLVSVELEEIMSLSDRILVMFEGRIVGEVPAAEASERMLGLMMANSASEEEARHQSPGLPGAIALKPACARPPAGPPPGSTWRSCRSYTSPYPPPSSDDTSVSSPQ